MEYDRSLYRVYEKTVEDLLHSRRTAIRRANTTDANNNNNGTNNGNGNGNTTPQHSPQRSNSNNSTNGIAGSLSATPNSHGSNGSNNNNNNNSNNNNNDNTFIPFIIPHCLTPCPNNTLTGAMISGNWRMMFYLMRYNFNTRLLNRSNRNRDGDDHRDRDCHLNGHESSTLTFTTTTTTNTNMNTNTNTNTNVVTDGTTLSTNANANVLEMTDLTITESSSNLSVASPSSSSLSGLRRRPNSPRHTVHVNVNNNNNNMNVNVNVNVNTMMSDEETGTIDSSDSNSHTSMSNGNSMSMPISPPRIGSTASTATANTPATQLAQTVAANQLAALSFSTTDTNHTTTTSSHNHNNHNTTNQNRHNYHEQDAESHSNSCTCSTTSIKGLIAIMRLVMFLAFVHLVILSVLHSTYVGPRISKSFPIVRESMMTTTMTTSTTSAAKVPKPTKPLLGGSPQPHPGSSSSFTPATAFIPISFTDDGVNHDDDDDDGVRVGDDDWGLTDKWNYGNGDMDMDMDVDTDTENQKDKEGEEELDLHYLRRKLREIQINWKVGKDETTKRATGTGTATSTTTTTETSAKKTVSMTCLERALSTRPKEQRSRFYHTFGDLQTRYAGMGTVPLTKTPPLLGRDEILQVKIVYNNGYGSSGSDGGSGLASGSCGSDGSVCSRVRYVNVKKEEERKRREREGQLYQKATAMLSAETRANVMEAHAAEAAASRGDEYYSSQEYWETPHYRYAIDEAFLYHSDEVLSWMNVTFVNVTLSEKCLTTGSDVDGTYTFVSKIAQFLSVIYSMDTVMMNQFMYGIKTANGMYHDGYVQNMRTYERWSYSAFALDLEREVRVNAYVWVISKLGVFIASFSCFCFISAVTALIVRTLTSSGVLILFPFLQFIRAIGMTVDYQILDHAHPWLGFARRRTLGRGLHPLSHFAYAHLARLILLYAMYEACQTTWSTVFYSKSVPADLPLWIFASSLIWEYFSLIYCRSALSAYFYPRYTLLLFMAFHIYLYSVPHGFFRLALIPYILFMIHNIIFTLLALEVPATSRGAISIECPREVYSQLSWSEWSANLPSEWSLFLPLNSRYIPLHDRNNDDDNIDDSDDSSDSLEEV